MKQRFNYAEKSPKLTMGLAELSKAIHKSSLAPILIDLVNIRASQINGCTFCLDMHAKEAKICGERELRLYHVPAWRDSHLFTDKERAALEWTELLTELTYRGISDEAYAAVREHFSEEELTDLTFLIGFINTWNRLNVAFRTEHGLLDKAYGLEKAGLK